MHFMLTHCLCALLGIQAPGNVLYFFNAPPNMTEQSLQEVSVCRNSVSTLVDVDALACSYD